MVVSAGARRILVVDDDPMVATTVQRVLRPEGYEVDVALGGQEALERARAHQPDLVVLDLMMPGIDGLEVCRQLRATGTLPILVLTRDQLIAAVWAGEDTDDNVVAVYVGYLRAKLDGEGEPRLIQTVRGFGYSLREA